MIFKQELDYSDGQKHLDIALKSTDKVWQFRFKEQDVKVYDKIVIRNTVHLQYLHRKMLEDEALPTASG